VIPFFVKDHLVGMLAFRAHTPERIFDQADFHFFRHFAQTISGCVHNALIVEGLHEKIAVLQDSQSKALQTTKSIAIEQLAQGIAHEIHNPLTVISGKAQLLLLQRGQDAMPPHIEEALKTIVKQTKRAADITRKLLVYSQNMKGKRELLEFGKVIEETLAILAYQTSMDHVEVVKSIRPGLPRVLADVGEIREVFLNLLLNAVESIGSRGKINILLREDTEDHALRIEIGDTGKGIEAKDIDHLFNPFYTTRHESVGLGLFVTKQIMDRYQGSIRVESRPGKGSWFILKFPFVEENKQPEPEGNPILIQH